MKSIFRWAGSKRQLLPLLEGYWSRDFGRYVEPFAGSACFFFRLMPERALLADINKELICAYRQIKADALKVHNSLKKLSTGSDTYYQQRSLDPVYLSPNARAARFIYLNRYCFNGLYRTNQRGEFNVPYGGQATGSTPTKKELLKFQYS